MPDLPQVLNALGGEGATIFQARVQSVGGGVATILLSGGSLETVPYLLAGYTDSSAPQVNQQVYVLAQKNWGMLIIGAAPTGPARDTSEQAQADWDPSAIADWLVDPVHPAGYWVIDGSGDLVTYPQTSAGQRTGVWFYDLGDVAVPSGATAAAGTLLLDIVDFGVSTTSALLHVGLHTSASPVSPVVFTPVPDETRIFRVKAGEASAVPIPLEWVKALLAGTATGLYALADGVQVRLNGPGTLHLTFL